MVDHSRTITPPSQMLGWGSHQEGDSIFQADISRLPPVSPDILYFTDKFQRFITVHGHVPELVSWTTTCTNPAFTDTCPRGLWIRIYAIFTVAHPTRFHGHNCVVSTDKNLSYLYRTTSVLFSRQSTRAVLKVEHMCCFQVAHVS